MTLMKYTLLYLSWFLTCWATNRTELIAFSRWGSWSNNIILWHWDFLSREFNFALTCSCTESRYPLSYLAMSFYISSLFDFIPKEIISFGIKSDLNLFGGARKEAFSSYYDHHITLIIITVITMILIIIIMLNMNWIPESSSILLFFRKWKPVTIEMIVNFM